MRRRALLMGQRKQEPLIIEIDTRNLSEGSSDTNTFVIPTIGVGYKYRVDWGDGVVTSNHNGDASHAYSNGGVYEVKIYGQFPRFYFNGGGDRLKIKRVISWGSLKYSPNQTRAFYECENLIEIAESENAWYNDIEIGDRMFTRTKLETLPLNFNLPKIQNGFGMFSGTYLSEIPEGMTLSTLANGSYMFEFCPLTSLPSGMVLDNLTNGNGMFNGNSLTSLPSGMTLDNLTNGAQMFYGNSLTSLPSGMVLDNLTNGNSMFYNNNLTSLPIGMTLANLTNGFWMFRGNSLTSLPDGMTLANLTNGNSMFYNNNLTSLPDGMTLDNLTNGYYMFAYNNLTSLPDGMTLDNLTNGEGMFLNSTINTARYSQLLIDMANLNPNNNVTFHAGNSKYNSSAVTARAILTDAPRNWTIIDGGLE